MVPMRPDSPPRLWRYINLLLTYLLTYLPLKGRDGKDRRGTRGRGEWGLGRERPPAGGGKLAPKSWGQNGRRTCL